MSQVGLIVICFDWEHILWQCSPGQRWPAVFILVQLFNLFSSSSSSKFSPLVFSGSSLYWTFRDMDSKSKDTKSDKDSSKDAAGDTAKVEPTKRTRIAEMLFLDDDDDFEEFPVEDWTKQDEGKEDEKATAWSENWDDDELDDEFSKKLKAELEKIKSSHPTSSTKGPVPMTH